MNRQKQRKAFTVVEMVIVIAVIAILATVLIPTISGVIQQANISADRQFAASLNIQLAMWEVDNGTIDSESDLRDAINYYYGDPDESGVPQNDYYSTLAPKSGKYGYHYWYDVENKQVLLSTYEDLLEINSGDNTASIEAPVMLLSGLQTNASAQTLTESESSFSPESLRSGLIEGFFLMDHAKDSNNIGKIITDFEKLDGGTMYTNVVANLKNYIEKCKEGSPEHELSSKLLDNVFSTTIITDFGAFRHEDITKITAVYVPITVKVINVVNVYVYHEDLDESDDGKSPSEAPLATPNVTYINIPKDVKVAPNGLPAIYVDTYEDTVLVRNYDQTTQAHVSINTKEDLKEIFDMMATKCVIVTPIGRFVIYGSDIYELPLNLKSDGTIENTPVVGGLSNSTGANIDLMISCPEGNTTAGENTIYFNKTDNILYVSYDRTEAFTLTTTGAHSSLIQWSVTHQQAKVDENGEEVKDEDGKTVYETVVCDWINMVGNKATLNHELQVGEDPNVTITAKVKGTESSASITGYLVRPNDVLFDLGTTTNISGVLNRGVVLYYLGDNTTMFELANAKAQYNPTGKVKEESVSFALKELKADGSGLQDCTNAQIVTESGKTYLKLKDGLANYTFDAILVASVGDLSFEITVKVIDNSNAAFEPNKIVDNTCNDNNCTDKENCTHNDILMGQTYLFRIGNENAVTLSQLFKTKDAATNIVLEIYDVTAGPGDFMINSQEDFTAKVSNEKFVSEITNAEGKPAWKLDSTDWGKVSIDFAGTGVAKIRIGNVTTTLAEVEDPETGKVELVETYTYNGYAEISVEVVNGKNVTKYSELKSSGNSVLMNNIDLKKDDGTDADKYALSNGTIFGNGFTFDVTKGGISGQNMRTNYLISLNNANLDNVQVVGPVYTSLSITAGNNYNRPVVLTQGTCGIYNSYISNAAAPVRLWNGELTIVNTTLKGGAFANLDMRGGDLILDDVTTINQVNGNDAASNGKVTVGLGIVVWYEGTNGSETIRLVDVDGNGTAALNQYNYLANNQSGNLADTSTSQLVNLAFGMNNQFIKEDGSVIWLNTGILSMHEAVGEENIHKPSGYEWEHDSISFLGNYGHLCTLPANNFRSDFKTCTAPAYVPNAQYAIVPELTWTYPEKAGDKNYVAVEDGKAEYCYYDPDTRTVKIRFEKDSSFSFDPHILVAKKLGNALTVEVSMNGTPYTGNITFTEAGDYVINYTYTDTYNYKLGGTYQVSYTKTVKVQVLLQDKAIAPADFDFNGNGYKKVTIGTKTYIMPKVDDISDTIGRTTISGQTIYYLKVNTRKYRAKGWVTSEALTEMTGTQSTAFNGKVTAYCPVFDKVITIKDNGKTYDSSTTDLADGKLQMNSDKEKVLKWNSSAAVPDNPVVKMGILCFQSATISGVNRDATTYVFEYVYNDDAGNTYHYFVGYNFPKCKK